jgi:hypothetical protein
MTKKIQTIGGLPVYDADDPLVIEIIPADIRKRYQKHPDKCAVAEACKRELHVSEALAYRSRLYVRHGDHWKRYQMPETLRNEVITFDKGGGFTPGTYRIPTMPPSKLVGAPYRGGQGRNTGRGTPHTVREVHGVRAHSPLMGGAIEATLPYRPKKDD